MRTFKATTHLTLPQALQAGPGATHVRLAPGETVELDEAACAKESRFIAGRVRAGDLVEITAAPKAPKGKD